MQKKFVLIVDLDGVIVDTFSAHVCGWKKVAKLHGKSLSDFNFVSLKGVSTLKALDEIRKHLCIETEDFLFDESFRIKNETRDEIFSTITPEDIDTHLHDFLECIDFSVCEIVCFATTTRARDILEKLGILDLFSEVYCGSMINVKKINSLNGIISMAKTKFTVESSNIIVLDDSAAICSKFAGLGVRSFLIPNVNVRREFYENSVVPYVKNLNIYLAD